MEKNKIRSECEFIGLKDNRLKHKCNKCNDISAKSVNDLKEKFLRTHKFCNGNLNKFVLLLSKGVYSYEYRVAGKDLMKYHYHPKNLFIVN